MKKLFPSNPTTIYRGRFAPSPTGPLHFGSLVTALGSYLDAKAHHGQWLVRIEDVDRPRCNQHAADDILFTLEALGLHWDQEVWYQSKRDEVYQQALEQLKMAHICYPCSCSRKEISESSPIGLDGYVYQGKCRQNTSPPNIPHAWRVLTNDQAIYFEDRLLGRLRQKLQSQIGDFVIKRADGLFAYQLAATVDDHAQSITHIVRGLDLLSSTPRQIYLQQQLGYSTPDYLHLPLVLNEQGEKLSKQTKAPAINRKQANQELINALKFLQQKPPDELVQENTTEILHWGIKNWNWRGLNHAKIED